MDKLGFDNQKYLELQSAHIRERIGQFGDKLYLEFGGKLFDDYHASRVLPGFQPDSKIRMLKELRDSAEIVIAICASDIEKNKVRGDLGITYDVDVLRLIDAFRGEGLLVGAVVVTQYAGQPAADAFRNRMESLGVRTYLHYPITGYPHNTGLIVTPAPWWWSPPPAPAAGRWRCACPSSTTITSGGSRRATPSSRPSPSGTCPSSTR